MSTFIQMVEAVKQQLQGFTLDQELVSQVNGAWDASSTSLNLDPKGELSKGVIEVDDELLFVQTVDRTTGAITAIRGWNGTTAATHADNAVAILNPKFPRHYIKTAINDTIGAVYPDLYVVKKTTVTWIAAQYSYQLPTDVGQILYVSHETIGPSKTWLPIQRYYYNANADTTAFANGKSVTIDSGSIVPGKKVNIVYTAEPTKLSSNSGVFATVTGLPSTSEDVMVWGACARLVPSYEAARLQQAAIEQNQRSLLVEGGQAIGAARYFMALYQKRLEEERDRLQRLHDRQLHSPPLWF